MISVIIPNYNGVKLLEVCLDAFAKQTLKDYECIIVDNGSKDNSKAFIKSRYPSIHIIELDKNYGFSYAVNRGIESSKGEYVVLLNNDTKVYEDWLENLYDTIVQNEKVFSVGSKIIKYHEPDLIDDAGEAYNILGWAYQLGAGKSIKKYNKPYKVFANCGGAVIYRKSLLNKIGYFDEDFFAYMEDIDIGYRALMKGYMNVYEPKARVLHLGSATSGGRYNCFKTKLVARNNIWMPYKNMPNWQLILNSPFFLVGFFIKYLFFCRKKLGSEYLSGLLEGIKNLKLIKKKKASSFNMKRCIFIQGLLIKNTFMFLYEKLVH